ncbi:hypothetical protein U9M48_002575 [Paspalum notatum var. saurae]|uniref:Chalcone synthase n=1 Tax=Paspalum notatum var. saurae TaxID=547442 RepID=A0AAQ3PR72_PASNO
MAATAHHAGVLHESQQTQRPNGPAAVLAIGTANPVNCLRQDEYPDWYFRITNSDHLTTLKNKMKRICEKSGIEKRHFHSTDETIAGHPEFLDRAAPSLDARLRITESAVPELAAASAARAIAEWGRPATDITHLVLATNSIAHAPGADHRVAALLSLRPDVQRTLLCFHGCYGGCSALRVARDLAETSRGARVLVASAEVVTSLSFRAPDEASPEALVAAALFGDGAGAAVVGADPEGSAERAVFYLVAASQATLPGTERALSMRLGSCGYDVGISAEIPALLRGAIEECLVETLAPLGLADTCGHWNGLFWAVHPGGRAILDSCETALALETGNLAASRHVLSEYGNMFGATIFFVLDEIRRRRRQDGGQKEGDMVDCEWGVMVGIGPGITVEMMVLRAASDHDQSSAPPCAAIGTANPANCVPQDEYADWYFRVTNSDHLAKPKAKMKKICETLIDLTVASFISCFNGYNSGIKKRYFHHTADTLRDHPELVDRALPSLDARQAVLAWAVPELAAAAAANALAEWGRPASDVTHLVLATYSGAHMPGADLRLASLLGLRRSAQRTMLYLGGCAAGSAALRVARDVAENNPGARVLVACADLSLVLFRAPGEDDPATLVMQALFGRRHRGRRRRRAPALRDRVGLADGGTRQRERRRWAPRRGRPRVLPLEEDAGFGASPRRGMPAGRGLAARPWRRRRGRLEMFWAVHPGGPAILDGVEAGLALEPEKLAASRRVLREYGNMSGASMIFVLDELRREELDGRSGVMLGLGPGITVETMVLRSAR